MQTSGYCKDLALFASVMVVVARTLVCSNLAPLRMVSDIWSPNPLN